MTTTQIETMQSEPIETTDSPSHLVTVEEGLRRAFAGLRETQARAAQSPRVDDFPQCLEVSALEDRPLRIVATVTADATDVWLLDPGQIHTGAVGLYVSSYHPPHRGGEPFPYPGWPRAVTHTKAFADLLDAIDWVVRDTESTIN